MRTILPQTYTLKTEAISSFETSVSFYHAVCIILKDGSLQSVQWEPKVVRSYVLVLIKVSMPLECKQYGYPHYAPMTRKE